jgi:hypothetical protein
MEYINKLKQGNDALEYLRSRGVYLYYGNYKFKGIQDIFLDRDKLKPASKKDKEIFKELVGEIDNKEELNVYEGGTAKLTPIEIKIEIFYFKEFFNNYSIPSRYKIYPNLGYTEKQLIDDYISALKKNKFEEQEIESVKEWLKNISYLNWYIKERVENSSNLISLGNYLPSNFYLDMSSENLNYFKFFESDAKSYNGNFEEVFEYPHIRKLEWSGSRYFENTVVQESEDIDKIFQNKKEEPMK